ncbi:MAG: hypothetical protein CMJ31_09030 [Phycisphaerae bacterium]|nr:hypothetical protein [Phycisphaerae bacterium]
MDHTTDQAPPSAARRWTRSPRVRALAALNLALLLVGAVVLGAPEAIAQNAGRPAGSYIITGSRPVAQGAGNVVYIIDAINEELVALRWNDGRKNFEGVGYRNLAADASGNPRR